MNRCLMPIYFLTISLESLSLGEECQTLYQVQQICDTIYGTTLATYNMKKSMADCVVECSSTSSCMSAVYKNGSSICITNSETLGTPSSGCQETVFYASLVDDSCSPVTTTTTTAPTTTLSTTIPYGSMFSTCSLDLECDGISDAECRDAKCQCVPGLSHSPSTSSCTPDCEGYGYGTTFQADLDHLLVGYQNKDFPAANDLECMDACVAETSFICRTAEFYKLDNHCYLSVDTVATQPQAHAADVNYNLYQRDCLP